MRVLLLAGEESGVLYADRIRAEILRRYPEAEIRGYGDYGFRTSDLAVMGLGQVLKRIFYFLRVKRTMERAICEWWPDCVCTVDYPGLNLKLAAFAHARGIRAVHVVCPQVWAWKRGRIPRIEMSVDRLCCFFPFEPALFKPGFATFVGHPLVEEFNSEDRSVRGEKCGKILAVLPGSRMGEIEKHMPVLLDVISNLRASPILRSSEFKIVIPAANARAFRAISRYVNSANLPVGLADVRHGGAREILREADAAVVASGTATLEAALASCPTVLVYRVGWFFALAARFVIKGVKHIGLANIIAEKAGAPCPMPELLQENFTSGNVLRALVPLLADEKANADARHALRTTMALLQSDGGAVSRIVDCLVRDDRAVM